MRAPARVGHFHLLLFALLAVGASGSEPADIPRLIRQLGSPKFAEREAASQRLEAIGEPALDALTAAKETDPDIEVRHRAQTVFGRLEKKAYQRLQGEWLIVSKEEAGLKMPLASIQGEKLRFMGKQIELYQKDGTYKLAYRLDLTRRPRAIDIDCLLVGGEKYEELKGIYDLGEGTLTLCLALSGDVQRPRTFATRPGSDTSRIVLKRAPR